MKDFARIWDRVSGRRYSAVNTSDRELRELTNNRLKKSDIVSSGYDPECQGLNRGFEDFDFSDGKDAIIDRLFETRKRGKLTRQPKCLFVLLMVGFTSITIGCSILFVKPYELLFNQKVIFSNGGEIFEMWRKPEVDLYIRIYLFNVTNAEAFMAGDEDKLVFKEIGPYVYKEGLEHEIKEFNTNGTLTAVPKHPLTWMEDLSEGRKEDDVLYLPNIALLSIANVVAKKDFITRTILNGYIKSGFIQPLVQMTAKEFMMGYKSSLMTLGNTFLPGWIYFDKLGLIDRMYDFDGDYETIFTGEENVRDSGLIDTYKGSTDLPHWQGKHCSNVQFASDGTKFRGGMRLNESMLFYRKSMCRAAPLVPKGEGVKSGLTGYMYTFPDNMLDNGKYEEDNKCFCREGKCLPPGLIDVADCYYGFPIALSYPHFYQGDKILFNKLEGMSPNQEEHETRFWVEPQSGLPLDVSSKFQINMALDDLSSMSNCGRFSNIYLPMLWFDIRMYALPQSLETRFRFYLNILPIVEEGGMYFSFALGITVILFTIYRLTFKIMFKTFDHKKQKRNIIIGNERKDKSKIDKSSIYAPCEVPLNRDSTDSEEYDDKPSGFIKTHSERIKELSLKLGDKVQDSMGTVKVRVKDELTHVRNIFKEDRKNSLIPVGDDSNINDAYKSDSSDDQTDVKEYQTVNLTDTDDECKYLEVLDDGSGFDNPMPIRSSNYNQLSELDAGIAEEDLFLHIAD